jgi:hypothetical protein
LGNDRREATHLKFGPEWVQLAGKMIQDPVRGTVWAWSIADLDTSGGFLNLLKVG